MFRNVLVAIDGSPHGAAALTEAIDVVKQNNARMTIMTSVPDPSAWLLSGGPASGGVDFEALAADTESEYRTLLDSAVDQVPAEIPVTKVLAHGRPANRILKQLKEGGHDLVIMGSRGRGEVRSLLLGSVSHEVLNASPAAALIVHADPDAGRRRFRRRFRGSSKPVRAKPRQDVRWPSRRTSTRPVSSRSSQVYSAAVGLDEQRDRDRDEKKHHRRDRVAIPLSRASRPVSANLAAPLESASPGPEHASPGS